jgi:hypothetical protein
MAFHPLPKFVVLISNLLKGMQEKAHAVPGVPQEKNT